MYTYRICGLHIRSALPLPGLFDSEHSESDIVIKTGKIEQFPPEKNRKGSYYYVDAKEAYFFYEDVGLFSVRNGREIIVEPSPGTEEQLLSQPLLGIVFDAVLYQRGYLVLHASGTSINTHVVAFLGVKGMGKSTLTAAFYKQGYRIVADDMLAVNFDHAEGAIAYPGFSQIRLWPDAVVSLGEDPETWEKLHPLIDKRCRMVTDSFPRIPFRLRHIYIITEGPRLNIEPFTKQEAFIEVIRHSFPTRLFQQGSKAHFLQCAAAARNIAFYRLSRPSSLSLLPDIVRMVEEHLRGCIEI